MIYEHKQYSDDEGRVVKAREPVGPVVGEWTESADCEKEVAEGYAPQFMGETVVTVTDAGGRAKRGPLAFQLLAADVAEAFRLFDDGKTIALAELKADLEKPKIVVPSRIARAQTKRLRHRNRGGNHG